MFGISIGAAIAWVLANHAAIAQVASLAVTYGPRLFELGKEGLTAMQAAQQAAPDLVPHIKSLAVDLFKNLPATEQAKTSVPKLEEHIARGAFNPGWSDEETRAWWDRQNLGL